MNGARVAQQIERCDHEQGADQGRAAELRCSNVDPPVTDETEARRHADEDQRPDDERRSRQRQARGKSACVEGDGPSDLPLRESDRAKENDL